MICVVLHAAHQHAFAKVLHLRADAEQAPGFGKAAVCGHQQAALQRTAVIQGQFNAAAVLAQVTQPGTSAQCRGALGLQAVPCSLADSPVGNQMPQVIAAGVASLNLQGKGGRSVEHLCIAQQRNVLAGQAVPDIKLLQQSARGVGQGDFATVEGGVGYGLFALTLDQRHRKAAVGQSPG